MDPKDRTDFRMQLQQATILWAFLCLGAPILYAFVLFQQVLKGDLGRLRLDLGVVPWGNPFLAALLAVSTCVVAAALLLPARIRRQQQARGVPFVLRMRMANTIACALLDAVAIYGLLLGLRLGPPAIALSLAFMAVPMVAGLFIRPSEAAWQALRDQEEGPVRP